MKLKSRFGEKRMIKKINGIVLFASCFLVGVLISLQLNIEQNMDGVGLIPIHVAKAYEEQLSVIRADKEQAKQRLAEAESKTTKLEEQIISGNLILKSRMAELETYKMNAGVYDVEGPGITITIKEPEYIKELDILTEYIPEGGSVVLFDYDLLLNLMNHLKRAGAEAISINGQRIIATTEFNYVNNAIYINKLPTAPPYIIKATGNPDTMESLLTLRKGILDMIKNQYGLQVRLEKSERIEIPRYSNHIKYKYAEPEE
jgi:uncharacterized protein YlxW (UPF0749 family)